MSGGSDKESETDPSVVFFQMVVESGFPDTSPYLDDARYASEILRFARNDDTPNRHSFLHAWLSDLVSRAVCASRDG